jgi:hypothetical protein
LIPSLLLAASLGTACSPLVSSWVVEALGLGAGLITGLISLALVLLLVVASAIGSSAKNNVRTQK